VKTIRFKGDLYKKRNILYEKRIDEKLIKVKGKSEGGRWKGGCF